MKKLRAGLTTLIALALFGTLLNGEVLRAQSQSEPNIADTQVTVEQTNGADSSGNTQVDYKAVKRYRFLNQIKDEIRSTQKDYRDVNNNVRDDKGRLAQVAIIAATLKSQVDNLDQQIQDTEDLIINVESQIAQKENELVALYDDIQLKKVAIDNQKEMLLEYLKTLYVDESSVTNTMKENDEINIAKMLLSNDSAGEQLSQIKYFKILEQTGQEIFNRLQTLLSDQENDQKQVEVDRAKLTLLQQSLEEEKNSLDVQREAKANLLEQTKGEEKIYQQLLEQSKQQQAQVEQDLITLHGNLTFMEDKIKELGDKFNPDDYNRLLNGGDLTSVVDYINATQNDTSGFTLMWPVSPSNGISAYFHDEAYVHVFGVPHQAIDIRVPQGTPVRAPADGVVYKVRDNGYGYSYLMVAHKGGYMTVYGHISEFKVQEGEKVTAGETIALSGATPGTKGAGLMTTGPHLHFEVIKDGQHVDPLDYLALQYLPFDSLPEKYQNRIIGEQNKVRRLAQQEQALDSGNYLTQMIDVNGTMEEFKTNPDENSPQAPAIFGE